MKLVPSSRSVAAVIPAFNEENSLGHVVEKTGEYVQEVIVVDDHSNDGTALVAKEGGAKVVVNLGEKGVGQAVLRGIRAAKGEIVVTLDADGQHPPEDIPSLLAPIMRRKADFVIGKRPRLPPSEAPARKAVASILGRDLDVGSGFRAFRKRFLAGMKSDDLGYCGCGSLILYAAERGSRIVEVPINVRPRKQGRSKFARVAKIPLHRAQARFLRSRYSATQAKRRR